MYKLGVEGVVYSSVLWLFDSNEVEKNSANQSSGRSAWLEVYI